MTREQECALLEYVRNVNRLLKDARMSVAKRDFQLIDGEWTLDGMDPYEWADAMTQE